jgi:Cellulase (glycosyl hydrolase family 5)
MAAMQSPLLKRFAAALTFCVALSVSAQSHKRWTEDEANAWYAHQPWLVGSDYLPYNAINELEMWQAPTFDPQRIDLELGWAESIGMNTMRVFLHDLLWQQDSAGFRQRIDSFLALCAKHHIRPILVIFDSCWDPNPELGPQHPPIPGIHNSGWVQSPGRAALSDPAQYPRLEAYVKGVIVAFANDPRILAWDLWNEPDNGNEPAYAAGEPTTKQALVEKLLPQVFDWARSANPSQPLTSGLWQGDWSSLKTLTPVQRTQVEKSDVLSFHNYGWPEDFEQHILLLEQYHRPILCTEYMARGAGSTFDTILPLAQKYRVAAINWGFVQGKSQTWLPWDSWTRPYVLEQPVVWHHDIFHPDGKPYRQREIDIIRTLTTAANGPQKSAPPSQ